MGVKKAKAPGATNTGGFLIQPVVYGQQANMEAKFSVNREVRKMLEIIAREPVLQRLAWALVALGYVVAVRWW